MSGGVATHSTETTNSFRGLKALSSATVIRSVFTAECGVQCLPQNFESRCDLCFRNAQINHGLGLFDVLRLNFGCCLYLPLTREIPSAWRSLMRRRTNPADLLITELRSLVEHAQMDDLVEAWEKVTRKVCVADTGSNDELESEFVRCDDETVLLVFPSTTIVKSQLDYLDTRHRESYGPDGQLAGQNWISKVNEDLILALHKNSVE